MQNIITDVAAYITAHVALISDKLYIDAIPIDTGNIVVIRTLPGQYKERSYFNGSRRGETPFNLIARSNEQDLAYNQLCAIQEAIDMADVQLTDTTLVTIEPTAQPSLVSKTDAGDYTYTAGFRLKYYSRG